MKKLYIFMVLLAFFVLCVASNGAFAQTGDQEEIDFLLFLPNSGDQFADATQATTHLNTIANYIKGRNVLPGQIYVYGYAAEVNNDIDPVQLSKNRAFFVIQELQRRGIAANLFADPVGYGHVNLWGNNIDEPDRSPNRRVRILVENVVLTPAIVAEPEPEPVVIIEPVETVKVTPPKPTEEPPYSLPFPWWLLLLPLLLIPAVLLASKRKKDKPAKPKPVIVPKPEQPKVEPKAEPPKDEPVKAAPIPFFAPKAEQPKVEPKAEPPKPEPPKEKVKVLGEEEIRLHAYGLFGRRYGQNGDADGDWYNSICELTAHYQAQGYRVILYWDPEAQTML
jgi:hypothetical protein